MRCLVIVLALMTMLLPLWLPEARACPDTIEPSPAVTATPASTTLPVRAVSLDLSDLALPRDRLERLEQRMRDAGVNMVGLSAGRLDWTGFRWSGKEERWSAGVRESGRDLLANATQRFGRWAHVSAIVDVFAPRYLQTRPTQRALDAAGHPIPYQASTHALVNGSFGDELIAMIDYIARHYEVDSITLTELFYYQEGYGADDLALYREHSGRRDWPRTPRGSINISIIPPLAHGVRRCSPDSLNAQRMLRIRTANNSLWTFGFMRTRHSMRGGVAGTIMRSFCSMPTG
ncbi:MULTISPECIES: hypothetical protein [Roseiflexus]|uniref:hypothetical protein n=1 Tax=Roseiflexus TaxID=120961 RepID=UPI0000E75F18|nr:MULTISPECIES: hypothetical protein [Roseiflexus]GIW02392.1 MAG: hypothetical protein KatS3mg058_3795 [Roseiflexus sp.]